MNFFMVFSIPKVSPAEFYHLRSFALGLPDYLYDRIQDATGIKGSWDFVLSFSSARVIKGGGMGAPPPADGAAAPEPIGAVSFFDAAYKQLGLKLEKQKRPSPVLVVDHIEEKPTEN